MFKKFLAVLGILGILSTGTAFAIDPLPGGANPPTNKGVVVNYGLSAATFNPTTIPVAGTVKVTFDLKENADVFSYVLSSDGNVMAVLAGANTTPITYKAENKGPISYTWDGKDTVSGAILPDGVYTIKTFTAAKDLQVPPNEVVSDSAAQIVTLSTVNQVAPKLSGFKVDPATFSPANGENTDIYFKTDKDGFITVKILSGKNLIRAFTEYTNSYFNAGSFSIGWDGKDDNGNVVADSLFNTNYTVQVTASDNGLNSNSVSAPVKVATVGNVAGGSVKNFYIDPANTWNPLKGGVDIHYQLIQKVTSLHIQAKQVVNNVTKVVKILDDKNVDNGYYTETWDGTDDSGNYVDEGTWTISVIVNGVTVTKNVTVAYTQPAVVESFVSKDSFDPSRNEMQNFVFKINAKAVVSVEAFKGVEKEIKLVDEQTVQKNQWYTVAWDGRDADGAEVDNGSDWKFKITAKNPTAQDLLANKSVSFAVEQDTVTDKKSNVTNDTVVPVVYDKNQSGAIEVDYSIDQDAQVFLAVYEGNSTGGKAKITLLDYLDQAAGEHSVSWNGSDTNGKTLKDGIYSYKLITKVNGNYKETETGSFVIGTAGEYLGSTPQPVPQPTPNPEPSPEPSPIPNPYPNPEPNPYPKPSQDCGGYVDTKFVGNQNYDMCQAISWVSDKGIFSGYEDGSFGPNTPITRTQVLKVVLKAFPNVTLLPSDGSNQGFWDADPAEWYMPFIRTAKFYSMLQGYKDGSAGVNKHISRAEFLKFALKASEAFTGYKVPNYAFSYYSDVDTNAWYKDFAGVAYEMGFFGYNYNGSGTKVALNPNQDITRGEVALILYRMSNNHLLGSYPMNEGY
ncbi:S-layer homology domain-containing protein [Candidatus Peregrinibacteria bacterium]|nr:S-layer homology domain-containing protein [Candidatus Peregrinibacteria bacterium]